VAEGTTPTQHDVYEHIHTSLEFRVLRSRYRGFVIPAIVAFMTWYLLYVIMSSWAAHFMSIKIVGNINVALVFGLLQFVSTFLIAWLYARHADRELDPVASKLQHDFDEEMRR
jgi:uncharacterized membrane protein (DUF485 family)